MAEPDTQHTVPRFRVWAVATAAILGLTLFVAIIWGVVLAAQGGQTPFQSYVLTVVLTVLSIAGGWIIAVLMYQSQTHDRRSTEQRQQEDLERSAQSAVIRSFRIMGAMSRIQSHTEGEAEHNVAELRVRMRVIREAAAMSLVQTLDAIQDWRRFAPAVVDTEIEKAEKASVRRGEGWE